MHHFEAKALWGFLLATVVLAAGCGNDSTTDVRSSAAFDHAASGNDAIVGHFYVCKEGPAGITADFNAVVDNLFDDSKDASFSFTLAAGECNEVARVDTESGDPTATDVTVEEVPATGTQLTSVEARTCLGTDCSTQTVSNPVTLRIGNDSGAEVTFTNAFQGQGCTPGYWKNHLSAWSATGFAPGDDFDTTFGVDLFDPDITLEEGVNAKGGHENRLARHGTAALLSASHPDVSYDLTVAEVMAAVQAGDADLLEASNEQFCPLD